MARNKVMTLWTAIVTAFLALCTALGLITTTAAAAVSHTETERNSNSDETSGSTTEHTTTTPAMSPWSRARALPPTMKQRIRAEAHGKVPSCRHRPLSDASGAAPTATLCTPAASASSEASTEPRTSGVIPLQR
ncbi:DUF6344 domain-containing protein [Streptomyces leeuwenhoekii]|jgi:hypothetical protein|uniref:Secreted Protein n=1 Tax=Streptomyces leeuwenhoekii TaxID=1437453 RepID=A0A0F7VZS0_STRLW|nr:DUF6344 domain-containing protein [Streptomyces leeuwenhoekii]KMS81242.1 hypothetical protein ACH49_03465 [Streptomyces leeuwenhoekii]CQR63047.1 Secreted Protein [Streptomyces leeuwenhoekii]